MGRDSWRLNIPQGLKEEACLFLNSLYQMWYNRVRGKREA
jgi:hypothetical protein